MSDGFRSWAPTILGFAALVISGFAAFANLQTGIAENTKTTRQHERRIEAIEKLAARLSDSQARTDERVKAIGEARALMLGAMQSLASLEQQVKDLSRRVDRLIVAQTRGGADAR